MQRRKLDRWVAAGLISPAQADGIVRYESDHDQPWLQWAVFGLGGLAVAVGLIALVASNWDAIPDNVKLGAHLLLLIGAAVAVYRADQSGHDLGLELAVIVFITLILTGIALIGQVFQLSSPLWRPLLLWLVLSSPVLMLAGRGTLTALAWCAAYMATVFALQDAFEGWLAFNAWLAGLGYASTLLLVGLGMVGQKYASMGRPAFWQAVIFFGMLWLVIVTVLAPAEDTISYFYARNLRTAVPLVAASAVALLLLGRVTQTADRSIYPIVSASIVAATLYGFALGSTTLHSVVQAVIFIALFAVIAWAAYRNGHGTVAKWAVALIAARIIMMYFDVFGSLAQTGLGLIVSGLVVVLVAHFTFKFVRGMPKGST